jgi:hypothetical protein
MAIRIRVLSFFVGLGTAIAAPWAGMFLLFKLI